MLIIKNVVFLHPALEGIIQFSSYLFTYKLKSPEASYKVSVSKKKGKSTTKHLHKKYKRRVFIHYYHNYYYYYYYY
jgi:hypothetical protein